ncbi:MAG: UbiD family decarboxylase [Chloroflexi bacterium]|nr:UbiD family decarboxylase [Chloroflexota bacterium]MBV9898940.1 UbiD family decarboxylase [Chloroflexota bacterium]
MSREVAPLEFEVTAILEHLEQRREFPAVLFERTRNMHGEPSQFPILSNLWGTRERCAEMLGLPPEQSKRELGLHFAELMRQRIPPAVVKRDDAPVQAHVYQGDQADMWMLPGVRHFEMDLGPVLTMAHVMHAPGEAFYNVTFAKTFPESGRRGGLTIHTPHLSRMLREWERRGERAPIVNILGHHPAFWLGSLSLTGYGNDDYATCGAFVGEPLRLVPSVTWGSDFMVPADAEIIIEAELVPGERTVVDPFGEISRLYQAQELGPVMEVTAITHRDGAILQDVFSGHAEHFILGLIPREGSLLNQLSQRVGNVTAVHLPHSGTGRFVCYVSVHKLNEGHPKHVALEALSISPTFQVVVVVDDDIDVFSEEDVLWAVNTYVDPSRDVDFIRNMGRDSERMMGNGRVLIDATRPTHIAFPSQLRVPASAMQRIRLDDWLDPLP